MTGSGGDDRGDDEDEPEKYSQFHFTDDDGIPFQKPATLPSFEDGRRPAEKRMKRVCGERFCI